MILFVFVITCNSMMVMVENVSFVALNNSPHALQLYQSLHDDDAPGEDDPVISDERHQERICVDISNSGFFSILGWFSLDTRRVVRVLHQVRPSRISQRANKRPIVQQYRRRKLLVPEANSSSNMMDVYAFVCLFRSSENRSIIPAFVSKEYNIGSFGQPRIPGRFIFANLQAEQHRRPNDLVIGGPYSVILAEEAARVITEESGFNVELHYIRTRGDVSLAEDNESDPLCKLISEDLLDPNNQHERLCAAISRSEPLKGMVAYTKQIPSPCIEREISFKTSEASAARVENKSYRERMALCQYNRHGPANRIFSVFVSRAYKPNQIFTYRVNHSDRRIYLEYLMLTNVNIIDTSGTFFNFVT